MVCTLYLLLNKKTEYFHFSVGKLNVNISQEDIDLFVASDTDNDGKLSFDEFCDFTLQRFVLLTQ